MKEYSNLFILQLVYEHFEEFIENNFSLTFEKYFKEAKNKEEIKQLLTKYLFQLKFTKEEIKRTIIVQKNKMSPDELKMNNIEWEEYKKEKTKRNLIKIKFLK